MNGTKKTPRPPRFQQPQATPKKFDLKKDYHDLPRHQHGYGGGSPRSPQGALERGRR